MTFSPTATASRATPSATRIEATVEPGDDDAPIATTTMYRYGSDELLRLHAFTSIEDGTVIVLIDTLANDNDVRINVNDGTVFETQAVKR